MKTHTLNLGIVRAMYEWAKDPDRGGLLPEDFHNPFGGGLTRPTAPTGNFFGDPEITIEMAELFLRRCDPYQLRLFVLPIFFGLRATEPAMLFCEDVEETYLVCRSRPELAYTTKGRRDKRLPLIDPIAQFVRQDRSGPLLLRRSVAEGRERPALLGKGVSELVEVFQQRCKAVLARSAHDRQRIRDQVMRDAGATNYDRLEAEFQIVSRSLSWPREATLKDFRHLFASTLAAAGVPDPYRQYLMGHACTSRPIDRYTHLGKVSEWYRAAMDREWQRLCLALTARISEPWGAPVAVSKGGKGGNTR